MMRANTHRDGSPSASLMLILVIAGSGLLPRIVSAQDYYVSVSGSDSAVGTQTQPWQTIAKATGVVAAGDHVDIGAGTYSGSVTFARSGTSASRITVSGANVVVAGNLTVSGSYTTLSGLTCSPPSAGGYNAVTISGSNNILSGCTVTGYGASAADQATAIGINGNFNQVIDCTVRDMDDIDGFHVFGHDNTITRATVANLVQANYNLNHTDLFQTWGLNGMTSYNIVWRDCLFRDSDCQMGNTSTDGSSSIHDWTFINCQWRNISGTFFSGLPNTRFYNCIFHAVQGGPFDAPLTFYGVTGYSSVGSAVRNCVFLACGSSPTAPGQGGIATNGADPSSLTLTNNYIGTSSHGARTANVGTASINGGNPFFANTTTGDFHLGSGSVLIGAGVNLSAIFTTDRDGNPRPAGGAWDLGTYAYSGSANTPPTITDVSDQTTSVNTMKAVTVTVWDAQTAAGSLTVTATSANTTLVSNAHLVVTGTGGTRTLAITPTTGQTGSATITVTVMDGGSLSASDAFVLTVAPDTTAPATPAAPIVSGNGGNAPLLSGTTEAWASVTIRADGVVVATVTAGANGAWTWTVSGLAAGSHAITVSATDAAGNASAASPASTITVAPLPGNGGGGGSSEGANHRCGLGSGMAALLALACWIGAALRFEAQRTQR